MTIPWAADQEDARLPDAPGPAGPVHAPRAAQRAAGDPLRELQGGYHPPMASFTVRYSVGNEHNPGDPWGRSELVIHADGSARLDHHFSRGREPRA